MANLTGWHFLIILVVILLLFGAPKLPALARSLGQSMKILKEETKSDKKDDATVTTTENGTVVNSSETAATVRPEGSPSAPTDTPNKQ